MTESKDKILICSSNEYISNLLIQHFNNYIIDITDTRQLGPDYKLLIDDYEDQIIINLNSDLPHKELLKKPFHIDELILKMKKSFNIISNIVYIDSLIYNKISMLLTNQNNNASVELTKIENDIFVFLLNSENNIDKNTILTNILGYNSNVESHTVENHIYRLRQKIANITLQEIIRTDNNSQYYIDRNL